MLPRAEMNVDAVVERVRPIIDDVRDRGVEAVLEYGERFDGVRSESVRVPFAALREALDATDPQVRAALETSIERARAVHADQRRTDTTTQVVPGGTVTERWVPVARVGLYAPGGLAVYPSSVVMNVVPAQAAGVDGLVVCSPPQREFGGRPHPLILAAAALLGVDEVWAVGGAQAVALLAHGGVDTDGAALEPVDMVTGPGNVYVTAAKRVLRGRIGIDSEAGTTEIAVLADHTADPVHVAADLISQAEHDPSAASVLVTTSAGARRRGRRRAGHARSRPPSTTSGSARRCRASSRGRSSWPTSTPGSAWSTPTPPSTSRSRRRTRRRWRPGCATRARSSSGRTARSRWATTAPGRTTCCPPRAARGTRAGCRCRRSCAASTSSTTPADALRDVADQVVALAEAEDLPAHGQAVAARFGTRREYPAAGA